MASRDHHTSAIADQFETLEQFGEGLRQSGLESSNLIFGIDYTKSNLQQGMKTFGGLSLHSMDAGRENPYQQVIRILGKTLESFDDDGVIPTFGFGDFTTKAKSVFPIKNEDNQSCVGFEGVLEAYNLITPRIRLSGPTNFAPLINKAIELVKEEKEYHILVIVADGQVVSESATREAIIEASKWPLSIIVVGVGDGPWDMMEEFDDQLPTRQFDNFQFVNFHEVVQKGGRNPEKAFALNALMEIPDQYKEIRKLGLLDI